MQYTMVSEIAGKILHKWVDSHGKKHSEYVDFSPTFFIQTHDDSEYKGIRGENLRPKVFGNINAARQFRTEMSEVSGSPIHGNENYWAQFINERYPGEIDWDIANLTIVNLDIETLINDPESGGNPLDNPVDGVNRITAITVQCGAEYTVFGSQRYTGVLKDNVEHIYCESEKKLLVEFLRWWRDTDPDIVTGWNIKNFDIPYLYGRISKILGEENTNFLAPGAYKYTKKALRVKSFTDGFGRSSTEVILNSVAILDYLEMYKKFTFKMRERYSLDHIAYVELGHRKLDYSDVGNLDDLYEQDYNRYIDYNIRDVELIDLLDEKLNLMSLVLTLVYMCKIRVEDVFSQVRMWDTLIYNYLDERNIVVPPKVKHSKSEKYEGAYVREPLIGMHDWVVSFDLASLYPHLIQQYEISPEKLVGYDDLYDMCEDYPAASTLIENWDFDRDVVGVDIDDLVAGKNLDVLDAVKELDLSMAANGSLYRRSGDRSFLGSIMDKLYIDRKDIKKKMLVAQKEAEEIKKKIGEEGESSELATNLNRATTEIKRHETTQLGLKVTLNSAYGMIGNQYSRYYDVRIAEGITVSGQLSIRWAERRLNEFLSDFIGEPNSSFAVSGDTDSIYLSLAPIVSKYMRGASRAKVVDALDKFCEQKVQPAIDAAYTDLAEYMNAYMQKMFMDREVIADRMLIRAKKNYALNVWNMEGVSFTEPKLKIMGIESTRSSTPEICRNAISDTIRYMLTTTEAETQAYIKDFKAKYGDAGYAEKAKNSSVKDIEKWMDGSDGFKNGTPYHVKAAIVYNNAIQKAGLESKYPKIRSGDKVKLIYLKKENPTKNNVIAFPDVLPPELKLDKYIDSKTQFNKTFLDPVESLLVLAGWASEQKTTLF